MSNFDWREYPNLMEPSDDYTSQNLYEQYANLVGKALEKLSFEKDKSIQPILQYLDEYRDICSKSDKFSTNEWKQSKIMVGTSNTEQKELSKILYLQPIDHSQLFQNTSTDYHLLFIELKYDPFVVIGTRNEVIVTITYHHLTSGEHTIFVDVKEDNSLLFKFSNGKSLEFNDLLSWIGPLNLEIKEIKIPQYNTS